ncbi:hypothetical protein [Epilithonimonas sp. UC225_85]|uniref:hypothetical protein n=1 Tax=Epilithonimonas sp. UC225_85 TaxID=3350167 RepID=UPI0036D32E7D
MSEILETPESTKTKTPVFEIEKIEAENLPELQGLKDKQIQIVKDNPFIEIVDSKTYEEAKKSRTALVSARTSIENQDKFLASLVKKFREKIGAKTAELIAITKPHEDKQQDEVKRYEAIKEAEKAEKTRIEEERKSGIKSSIDAIIKTATDKIEKLSFELINTLKADFEENLFKTDTTPFEEFELDFNEKLMTVKTLFNAKIQQLQLAENQRLENIRLKEEADKLAKERAQMEADKKAEEARLAKAKSDQEAELQKQRKALAAEKKKQDDEAAAKALEAKKLQDEESAKLQKYREELEAEKSRIAKIESNRIAKEAADRKAKEDEERKIREAEEAEQLAKAEAERLEALKPTIDKLYDWLNKFEQPDPPLKEENPAVSKISILFDEFKKSSEKAIQEFIKNTK